MAFLERFSWAQPALILAVLVLPVIYVPGAWPWFALGYVAAGGVLFRYRRRSDVGRWALLLCGAAALALVWGFRTGFPDQSHWPFSFGGTVSGTGTVVAEAPVTRRGTVPFLFRVESVQTEDWAGLASAVVTVAGFHGSPPATGSRWSWTGKVGPGDRLSIRAWESLGWAAPWWEHRSLVRRSLEDRLSPLGEAPAALGQALLIGAVDDLTPQERDSFKAAGCSHVLALSGMHLSLLALALMALLRHRAHPWAVFLVVQGVLAAFCFLAGPIPSLWRAWTMAFLAGWWGLGKRPVPLRELLAQSFLASVFLWPDLADTLSLQLSFLALAGLFFWGQKWDRSLRPFLGKWGASQLASSAAALAATIPLTLVLFGEVRWIGLFVTPPLVFLTTLHMAGSLAVVLLGGIPWVDFRVLAPAFGELYRLTFGLTAWAGQFPSLGPGTVVSLVCLGGLGSGALFLYNLRYRRADLPVSLNYDSPASLQGFLEDRGYNALKRWGQNFLINAGARKQILAALDLKPGEPVWEVGPGLGALTHHLVEAGHPLTVFEIDPGYVAFLRSEFGDSPAGFLVVQGDVVKTWNTQPLSGTKTVGNLPYNAASAIVADFIEGGFFPEVFVVTVQLEMAQRMTASPGSKNYSSFSVLCQSAFKLDDVVTLKPGSFYPVPGVSSRVVRLRPHGLYPGMDHKRFSVFVRECFSSRRKTLRNNISGAAAALKVSDEQMAQAFAAAGIDLGLRAEALTVSQFASVFDRLEAPTASTET